MHRSSKADAVVKINNEEVNWNIRGGEIAEIWLDMREKEKRESLMPMWLVDGGATKRKWEFW